MTNRRRFLSSLAFASTSIGLAKRTFASKTSSIDQTDAVSFFLVGDTHYCAENRDAPMMSDISATYNRALIDQLNALPGTSFPAEIGGGMVPAPKGIVHAGDMIDNGDKGPSKFKMAECEISAFIADWGLNGDDGRLKWPVRETFGNHDSPQGNGPAIAALRERNQIRKGATNVSESGVHYSWDWGDIHFVSLGIVVGDAPEVTRKRRYSSLHSLPFLREDLREHVGNSDRPVVLLHHVDVHRYSTPVPEENVVNNEWDYGDALAFYETIKPYRVVATLCGHTHQRRIVRWDGTKDDRAAIGIPVLNTDNGAHFSRPEQAILHVAIGNQELQVREFSTTDGWQTGAWAHSFGGLQHPTDAFRLPADLLQRSSVEEGCSIANDVSAFF